MVRKIPVKLFLNTVFGLWLCPALEAQQPVDAAQKVGIPERDASMLLLQAELRTASAKVASAESEGGAKK